MMFLFSILSILLVPRVCISSSLSYAEQRLILEKLYESTGGADHWYNKTNWPDFEATKPSIFKEEEGDDSNNNSNNTTRTNYTEAHFCDWYGIECTVEVIIEDGIGDEGVGSDRTDETIEIISGMKNGIDATMNSTDISNEIDTTNSTTNATTVITNSTDATNSTNTTKIRRTITKIDLRGNNLIGSVPWEIFLLPNITTLMLSYNNLYYIEWWHDDDDDEGLVVRPKENDETVVTSKLRGSHNNKLSKHDTTTKSSSLSNVQEAAGGGNIELIDLVPYPSQTLLQIDISNNKLSGPLFPPSSSQSIATIFPNLEYLSVSFNRLTGTIPITNLQHSNIHRLGLSNQQGTGFTGPLPDFATLRNIRTLSLHANSLSGTIPTTFLQDLNPQSGISVNLASNSLNGTIPSSLARFEKVNLYITSNHIKGISPPICDKSEWMDGDVAYFGCNAILCPIGTYNSIGRQLSHSYPCNVCPFNGAPYFGSTKCKKESVDDMSKALRQVTSGRFWASFAAFVVVVAGYLACIA